MAQFRTTADILDEILQKAGEPINGNSPFEARALTYANKVHHAIIGGGNIFNINVDEPWVWARAHSPITLELQPAYATGYVTVINGGTNISFQTAPTMAVEGWHFQINGKSTVYKITQHTATGTTAQIDSSFVDDTGVYTFRAFKLDYPVFPAYMYIDNTTDRLDFTEGTTATVRAVTLTHGSYTPANLIAEVVSEMNSTGTASYTGGYDTVANTFSITASAVLGMLGASGASVKRSVLPLLGMDTLDYTGALTYSSTYMPNQVSRLIEPFKMFMTNWSQDHFCYSTDPIKMQEDYPLSRVMERYPERFCRIAEDNNGVIWVRFNSYPAQTCKLQVDWVPQPIDLQNNTASVVKLPRGDVDTLIHGATAFIQFDKEDSKFNGTLQFCKDGLEAMKKKNHNLLFRTGQSFGQIIPRADLNHSLRKLNYGYTVSGSTASTTAAQTVQSMIASTLHFGDFNANATAASATATVLAANRTLFAVIVKHSVAFAGAGIVSMRLNVGTLADPTQFINGFDPMQAVSPTAQESALVLYYPAAATPIMVQMISTGANLSNLTAGIVTLYFQEMETP